jgi:transposase InsO family protein
MSHYNTRSGAVLNNNDNNNNNEHHDDSKYDDDVNHNNSNEEVRGVTDGQGPRQGLSGGREDPIGGRQDRQLGGREVSGMQHMHGSVTLDPTLPHTTSLQHSRPIQVTEAANSVDPDGLGAQNIHSQGSGRGDIAGDTNRAHINLGAATDAWHGGDRDRRHDSQEASRPVENRERGYTVQQGGRDQHEHEQAHTPSRDSNINSIAIGNNRCEYTAREVISFYPPGNLNPTMFCPICIDMGYGNVSLWKHRKATPVVEIQADAQVSIKPIKASNGIDEDKVIGALQRAAPSLPKFDTGDKQGVVYTFLKELESALDLLVIIPSVYYVQALHACLAGDKAGREWVYTHLFVRPPGVRLTWEVVKARFTKQFQLHDYQRQLANEYLHIKQAATEDVNTYSIRFNELCRQLGRSEREPLVIERLLDSLLPSFKSKILVLQREYERRMDRDEEHGEAERHQFKSVTHVFKWCLEFEADKRAMAALASTHTGGLASQATRPTTGANMGGAKHAGVTKFKFHCVNHGENNTHATEGCFKGKGWKAMDGPPVSGNTSAGAPIVDRKGRTVKCFTCEGNHYANDCPRRPPGGPGSGNAVAGPSNPFAGSNRVAQHRQIPGGAQTARPAEVIRTNAIASQDRDRDLDEAWTFEGDRDILSSMIGMSSAVHASAVHEVSVQSEQIVVDRMLPDSEAKAPSKPRSRVSVIIPGHPGALRAFMDSGSERTMMSKSAADRLGLVYNNKAGIYGRVINAHGDSKPHLGATQVKEMRFTFSESKYNMQPVRLCNVTIEVMEVGENPFDIIVGEDRLHELFGHSALLEYSGCDRRRGNSSSVNAISIMLGKDVSSHYSTSSWPTIDPLIMECESVYNTSMEIICASVTGVTGGSLLPHKDSWPLITEEVQPPPTVPSDGIDGSIDAMFERIDAYKVANIEACSEVSDSMVNKVSLSAAYRFGMVEDGVSPYNSVELIDTMVIAINMHQADDIGNINGSGIHIPPSDLSPDLRALTERMYAGEDVSGYGVGLAGESPSRPVAYTSKERTEEYNRERARILSDPTFKTALERNKVITGFCNIAESEVYFKVDPSRGGKMSQRQFPIPIAMRPFFDTQVAEWLGKGNIEICPAGNIHNLAVFGVPKYDSNKKVCGMRIVIDARPLNMNITTGDTSEIPRIGDALEIMAGKSVFAEFDLENAFFQFKLHPECRKYTAFTWGGVQYQFVGCPFGINLLPSHFQRIMSNLLRDFRFVFAYIDNLPIGSSSFEQHGRECTLLVDRLSNANLKIKPSSINICQEKLSVLGHCVDVNGIGISDDKRAAVGAWEMPKTPKQVATFVGFATFMRNNIRHASELMAAMEAVKNATKLPEVGSAEHDTLVRSFEATKHALLHSVVLAFPKARHRLVINCDASNVGMGGVLYQVPSDSVGDIIEAGNIIAFCSKKWSDTESRYSTYKKELKGLDFCLNMFHSYIWGRGDVVLYTDHKPLIFMFKSAAPNRTMQLWLDHIQSYSFRIEHRPGVLNVVADALSRMYNDIYCGDYWGVPSSTSSNIAQIIARNSAMDLGEEANSAGLTLADSAKTVPPALTRVSMVASSSGSMDIRVFGTGIVPDWYEPGDDDIIHTTADQIAVRQAARVRQMEEAKTVFVAASEIKGAGNGLFTLVRIPFKHTTSKAWSKPHQVTIAEYWGEECDTRMDGGYRKDQAYQMKLDTYTYIDGINPSLSGLARYVNCPSAGYEANCIWRYDNRNRRPVLKPLRTIGAGEELIASYNRPFMVNAITRSKAGWAEAGVVDKVAMLVEYSSAPMETAGEVDTPEPVSASRASSKSVATEDTVGNGATSMKSIINSMDIPEELLPIATRIERILNTLKSECVEDKVRQREIVEKAHLRGHWGESVMLAEIRRQGYYWSGMIDTVKEVTSMCHACCVHNISKRGFVPAQTVSASAPFDHVQIDCCTHMPKSEAAHTALLLIIDVFSGFIVLRPIVTTSANCVAIELMDVFCSYGFPKIVQSDNGPEFSNQVIRALGKLTGFEHRLITPYHPQADGKVERAVRSVMSVLKKEVEGKADQWYKFVPFTQLMYNNKVATLTGSTPFSLMFGRSCNELKDYTADEVNVNGATGNAVDTKAWGERVTDLVSIVWPGVVSRSALKKSAMLQDLDARRRIVMPGSIETGSTVYLWDQLRSNKWEPPYVGPYTIASVGGNGTYWLRDQTGVMKDRPVKREQLKVVRGRPKVDKGDEVYVVEAIRDHRKDPTTLGDYQYYIKWKDYPEADNTWESAKRFQDVRVIQDYWLARKEAGLSLA